MPLTKEEEPGAPRPPTAASRDDQGLTPAQVDAIFGRLRAEMAQANGDAPPAGARPVPEAPPGPGDACPTCRRPFAEQRLCLDCGARFDLTPIQQSFFVGRGLELPKRCDRCRAARRHMNKNRGPNSAPRERTVQGGDKQR